MSHGNDALENTVKDAYIIYAESKGLNASEKQQRYAALVRRAEELQQQHGSERFSVTRTFEYVPAVAALIKDEGLVELLKKEGYAVERQGRMHGQPSQQQEKS